MADCDIHLAEYRELKSEQRARIGFRDNLLYVTLTALAAVVVFSFAGNQAHYPALLLIPPVCVILGWTYVANDRKISEIGTYIHTDLAVKLSISGACTGGLFGWESVHRTGPHRSRRKVFQAVVDFVTFCVSGYAALYVLYADVPGLSPWLFAVAICESFGLSILGLAILR